MHRTPVNIMARSMRLPRQQWISLTLSLLPWLRLQLENLSRTTEIVTLPFTPQLAQLALPRAKRRKERERPVSLVRNTGLCHL